MSYHIFVEKRVKTFEQLRGNGVGGETSFYRNIKGATHQLGAKRLEAKHLGVQRPESDTTSGGNCLGAKRLGV